MGFYSWLKAMWIADGEQSAVYDAIDQELSRHEPWRLDRLDGVFKLPCWEHEPVGIYHCVLTEGHGGDHMADDEGHTVSAPTNATRYTVYRPDADDPDQTFTYFDAERFVVEYRYRDESGAEQHFYRCSHCGCPDAFKYATVLGFVGDDEVFRLVGENAETIEVS